MICVYPADCIDFSTNGSGTLAPMSAEVTETLNGEYELTLVHPIDEAGKWQRLVEGCILRASHPHGQRHQLQPHHCCRAGHNAGVRGQCLQRLAGCEDRKSGRLGFRGVQRDHQ